MRLPVITFCTLVHDETDFRQPLILFSLSQKFTIHQTFVKQRQEFQGFFSLPFVSFFLHNVVLPECMRPCQHTEGNFCLLVHLLTLFRNFHQHLCVLPHSISVDTSVGSYSYVSYMSLMSPISLMSHISLLSLISLRSLMSLMSLHVSYVSSCFLMFPHVSSCLSMSLQVP